MPSSTDPFATSPRTAQTPAPAAGTADPGRAAATDAPSAPAPTGPTGLDAGIGRIPIMAVSPVVDGGRFPASAAVGETVPVRANAFREGHDAMGVQVVLTDPERPASAMDRIRTRFPQTVELRWEPDGGRSQQRLSYSARVRTAESPESLCASFFDHVRQRSVTEQERADIETAVGAAQSDARAD